MRIENNPAIISAIATNNVNDADAKIASRKESAQHAQKTENKKPALTEDVKPSVAEIVASIPEGRRITDLQSAMDLLAQTRKAVTANPSKAYETQANLNADRVQDLIG